MTNLSAQESEFGSLLNTPVLGLPTERIHRETFATGLTGADPNQCVFWWANFPRNELVPYVQALGPTFPLVGMYSGGMHATRIPLARHRALAEYVATIYAKEIMARFPDATFRLGGICFGGRIADLVSQKLIAAGCKVEALCVLDYSHTDLYRFPGRLLMLFSSKSGDRFYAPIRWGEENWEKPFQSQPQSIAIDCRHRKFFSKDIAPILAQHVRDFFTVPENED